MYDDQYQRQQENLTNPKNRFLGLFCHASEVDNSWGCGCPFSVGVIIFSIIIAIASFYDIYYIAKKNIFSSSVGSLFKIFIVIKILSDLISFVGIGISCYAVHRENRRYSIIAYWVIVLSFLLNRVFLVYAIIAIFSYWKYIQWSIIFWAFLEFVLLLYSWILFANQVYLGRQQNAQANQTGN